WSTANRRGEAAAAGPAPRLAPAAAGPAAEPPEREPARAPAPASWLEAWPVRASRGRAPPAVAAPAAAGPTPHPPRPSPNPPPADHEPRRRHGCHRPAQRAGWMERPELHDSVPLSPLECREPARGASPTPPAVSAPNTATT